MVVDTKGVNLKLTPNFTPDKWQNKADSKVNVSIAENVAQVKQIEYFVNDQKYTTDKHSFTIDDLKDGNYKIVVEVLDMSGNKVTSYLTVMKDTADISISVTGNPTKLKRYADLKIKTVPSISGIKSITVNGKNITGKDSYRIDKNGTYKFVLTNNAGNTKSITITADKIVVPVSKIKVNKSKITLTKGEKFIAVATLSPSNATYKGIKYSSSNTKVATVSKTGVIKAIGVGTAKIKISSKDNPKVYKTITVTVKYSAPSLVKAKSLSSSSIQVTWIGVKKAKKYYVYRATSRKGKYKKVGTTKTTNYIDNNVKLGKTYYYKVVAGNSNNKYNSDKSTYVKTVVRLAAPNGIQIINRKDNTMWISWERIADAVSYTVYCSYAKDGKYSSVATVEENELSGLLSNNRTRYFKIRANSLKSNIRSEMSLAYTNVIDRVDKVKASSKNGKVTLKWSKTKKATKYTVVRAESKEGIYKIVGTSKSAKFTDTSAEKGKTYYYKICASNGKDEGNNSVAVKIKVK